ncbi:ATP-binding protein [Polymorphospora sp. NPDC050346]|uniref:ATP-binding protein n=1 Tax=Polymorphospora sp. NPDC050346 TaxID=3155780 RepID=UPI003409EC8B
MRAVEPRRSPGGDPARRDGVALRRLGGQPTPPIPVEALAAGDAADDWSYQEAAGVSRATPTTTRRSWLQTLISATNPTSWCFRPDPSGVVPGEEGAVMTATLNEHTGGRKRPEPTAEAKAAAELVRAAKEQGLSLIPGMVSSRAMMWAKGWISWSILSVRPSIVAAAVSMRSSMVRQKTQRQHRDPGTEEQRLAHVTPSHHPDLQTDKGHHDPTSPDRAGRRWTGPGREGWSSHEHPPSTQPFTRDETSKGPLRHALTARLAAAGLTGDAAFDFVVAVHELVTNAVRHGGGHGRLELSLQDRTLICSISDHGSGVSGLPAGPPPNDRPGGRGLYLARQLTGALLIDQRGDGVTATVTVELPAAA